jgi:glycosyltransferase involved in cell wall biosynthesis
VKPKLHIHSDSPFFGGAENMVGLILTDPKMQAEFQVSFSYRQTAAYETGLSKWVGNFSNAFPLPLPTTKVEWICSRLGGFAPWFRLIAEPPVLISEFIKVTKLLRNIRPDILHLNNGGYPGALSSRLAPIAARLAGVKTCIMVVNNLAVPYNRPARILEWPLDALSKRFVSIYLTASNSASERLRQVLRLPASRASVIANGIASQKPSAAIPAALVEASAQFAGTVKLGIAAIFEPRKGHAVLFDALRQVSERPNYAGTSFSLFVQASPSDFNAINELVAEKGISSRVKILDVSAVDLINAIDIFVLPSTQDEDFPNVNLIAMALEKPIISTNLAGIPTQVTDQFNGLIVEPGDAVALATAIETLGCDRNLIKTLGANGLSRFEENYTAKTALENYHKLYQRLLTESD